MSDENNSLLDDYIRQPDFASAMGMSERAVARYRHLGLPFMMWNGKVYIHVPGAREFMASRTLRLNQRRVA